MLVYLSILGALGAGSLLFDNSGNDTVHGTEWDDTLDGGNGDDELFGYDGEDLLLGGDGNDIIEGGAARDEAYGGAGNDLITDSSGSDLLDGGDGNDTLIDRGADDGVDILLGGAGNDLLIEESPAETSIAILDGGSGDDTLWSQDENSIMVGGEGEDLFIAHNSTDAQSVNLYAYNTKIEDFTIGEDILAIGLEGDASPEDYWFAEDPTGNLALYTDQNAGVPLGHETPVVRLEGLQLGDISIEDITFLSQDDLNLLGNGTEGEDTSDGGEDTTDGGEDTTDGGEDTTDGGEDTMDGSVVIQPDGVIVIDQTLTGSEFNDTIFAGFGDDILDGYAGDDFLVGDDGNDTIDGDFGNDTIYAGDGNDLLRTEGAYNELYGDSGDDILWTTSSAQMTGGDGSDYFLPGTDLSVVSDYVPAEDTIVVPFSDAAHSANFSIGTDPDTGDALLMNDGVAVMQFSGIGADEINLEDIVFLNEEQTYAFLASQGENGPTLPDTDTTPEPPQFNVIAGTDGADTLTGSDEDDMILGGDTGDLINAGDGNDLINPGTDIVDESQRQHWAPAGSGLSATIVTTNAGQERLDPDTVYGEAGDDTIVGAGHDLDAYGGSGNDLLVSNENGIAKLYGGDGNDTIVGEGGDTAYHVNRFNNQRYAEAIISETSYIDGGSGDDTIVTAENTISRGGLGEDTFIIREPSAETSPFWNVIQDLSDTSEQIILTYTGETAPSLDQIEFETVRIRDLPGGSFENPTSRIEIQVDGTVYGYINPPYPTLGNYLSLEAYYDMVDNGQILFMPDSEVAALHQAQAARALLSA
ncbi:calcium-binding protein [Planktotalea sp.]|uniref:calcium-binding protein n=1 Tax=Planktotalea sp. TaxID=2029877 RepID=UPI003D6AB5C7